jgi:DNA-binding NarL/FixJ family response regulator
MAMRDDRERMLAAGFDGYLSKPVSIKKLREAVNRHLGGKPEQTAESVAKVDPEPTLAFGHPSAGGDLKKFRNKNL